MANDLGATKIPIRWHFQSGKEVAAGMTIDQFATLEDGVMELVRMRRWGARRGWGFTATLEMWCLQPERKAAVQDATIRLDRSAKATVRARIRERQQAEEFAERNELFGFK